MIDDHSPPHLRATLKALSLLGASSVVVFSMASVARGSYVLAMLEAFGAGLLFFIWWGVKKSTDIRWWGAGFTVCVFAIMLNAMAAPDTDLSVFGWACIIPLASYSILGLRIGLATTILFEILTAAVFAYRYHPVLDNVSLEAVLNVSIYSLGIWVGSHIYESSRESSRRELFTAATQDPLTGVLNRARLQSIFDFEVQNATKEKNKLCLLLCDLDHFKSINDNYGHTVGDDVLIDVAKVLKANTRENDYVFRIGGEEFCLILPGVDLNQGVAIANKLRSSIANLDYRQGEVSVSVTVSIGAVEWGGKTVSLEAMLREADLYLYQAKARGRNVVINTLDVAV